MCLPKCTGGTCPAAPAGATAIPTCEFSSTGKPPPDHCGLRCKNGETCPTGTTCEMPTGICAFPYPMGEPERNDLEAAALDEQLEDFQIFENSEPTPAPAQLADTVPSGTYCGSYQDVIKNLDIAIVNITQKGASYVGAVNISARVAIAGGPGVPVGCTGAKAEAVTYSPKDGSVVLANAAKPTDCLGKILTHFGAPGALTITYDKTKDSISIDADGQATIPLDKPSCK